MPTKKTEGSVSRKTKMNRGQLRELFTEQMMQAINKRGFVGEMFKMLDKIEDPEKKLKCAIELLKFTVPQLASQRVEVVNEDAPVTQIVFAPAATASNPTLKAANSKD